MPVRIELADWLDERAERFTGMADTIWARPEVALKESAAAKLQQEQLAAEGFAITGSVGGLPTAFMAEWGHGSPVIGFLGEYDALPGLSQAAQPEQGALVPDGPGHGCGHNLLGTAALAAALATQAWLRETGTAGTIRYYGCPAEETLTGKVFMARAGVFDDLDAALTWHPWWLNSANKGSFLAMDNLKFHFHGRTAHAAAQPDAGRSALDAVELMNAGVNFMREHIIESARIHYVITNGGGAPNVVPDEAEVWYFVRAPEREQVSALTERVRKIAAGAAMMTETTVRERFLSGCYNVLPNFALADVVLSALEELGPIAFSEAERAFAGAIASGYPAETRAGVLRAIERDLDSAAVALDGEIYPALDEGKVQAGSTDVGDVSWITPTVQALTTCWPLGVPGHSWGIVAACGMSIGHKGMLHAAKALAMTAAELLGDPQLLARVRQEFEARRAGRPYRCALPPELEPEL